MANPSTSQPRWYFTRQEIEENTPSRKDGINLMTETKIRKSYCKLLQDLGNHLQLRPADNEPILCSSDGPNMTKTSGNNNYCNNTLSTIFLYQSLAKNDFKTIAIACLLIGAKAKETPRSVPEVTNFSYVMIHRKDRNAALQIMQKEMCKQQQELIRCAEYLVLDTLNFDFDVVLPYTTLIRALKKFDNVTSCLAPTAWSLLRDWLQTSLYIQFEPHCLAVAALHISSVIWKNGDMSDVDIGWIEEFNVPLQQFLEICKQVSQFRDLRNIVI